MKKSSVLIAMLLLFGCASFGQVAVNADNSAADPSAMLDVKSTTKGFLTPRMTRSQRNAIPFPAQGLIVYNTTDNRPNYWNGTAWMKYNNTLDQVIGDFYLGGILAYILQSGDPGYVAGEFHGLIAAPADQSTGVIWGCLSGNSGATATALGTGQSNTTLIVTGCPTPPEIAARICDNLVLNGYSDWFLPSKDELNKLYLNKTTVGGFGSYSYWSSTEYFDFTIGPNAYAQNFSSGVQGLFSRSTVDHVRAVRDF